MEIVIALALVTLLAILLLGWLLLQVRLQGDRLHTRIEVVAHEAATRSAPGGGTAPTFVLPSLDERNVSSKDLLAAGKPAMLIFTDPRCGPCYELLPDIGGWQRVYGDRLAIALVSGGAPQANRTMTAEYGIHTVLLQSQHELADAVGAGIAPAAVVIRPDGSLGGAVVYGAPAVRQLVADTLGMTMPEAPLRRAEPIRVGEPVPSLRRPDLDGTAVDLGAVQGEPTLLLFWSPGCSHCQDLLPEMRAWELEPSGPRMLIVSRGPVALNRDAGLRSTIVLDDDQAIAGRFGVRGTPAAVWIDGLGMVASEVARGARGVRALAGQRVAAMPSTA